MNLSKLAEPFPPEDIRWRVGRCGLKDGKPWAKILAYVDARDIMNRLDEVCGPAGWGVDYEPIEGGFLCKLSICCDGVWVTKADGAPLTQVEPLKGSISDSLKRAANVWGVGRYLYALSEGWADCSDDPWALTHKNAQGKDRQKKEFSFSWNVSKKAMDELRAAGPAAKPAEAQEAAQKPAPAPAARDDTPLLTSPQKRKIGALRRDLGLSDEDYHRGLQRYYGRESTADLSKAEASSLIERLEARLKAKLDDAAGEAFGDGRLGKLRAQALGYCSAIARQGAKYVSGGEPVELPGGVALEELREMVGASGDEGELEGVILKLEKVLEDMAF